MFIFFYLQKKALIYFFFFFQAEDGIRDYKVTGVQTCALPISCSTSCSKWRALPRRSRLTSSGCDKRRFPAWSATPPSCESSDGSHREPCGTRCVTCSRKQEPPRAQADEQARRVRRGGRARDGTVKRAAPPWCVWLLGGRVGAHRAALLRSGRMVALLARVGHRARSSARGTCRVVSRCESRSAAGGVGCAGGALDRGAAQDGPGRLRLQCLPAHR